MNWDRDRRAQLWRKGAKMAREEAKAVDRILAAPARFRENPATDAQIEYLQFLRTENSLEPLDRIDCLKMTKAEASRQIKALKESRST